MTDELREPEGQIDSVDERSALTNQAPEIIDALVQVENAKHDSGCYESENPHAAPDTVYTELIIVEHALRSQYIELQRSRRRGLVFFGSVLAAAAFLTYHVWYNASVYKMIRLVEQLLMIALYITAGLFILTGMFTKVFSVAPRFLVDTNKGLKTLNFRMVKTQTTLKERLIRLFANPVFTDDPAGPIKLVLSPREFSSKYIEDWEVFRDEYWDRQRRRRIRAQRNRKTKSSKK